MGGFAKRVRPVCTPGLPYKDLSVYVVNYSRIFYPLFHRFYAPLAHFPTFLILKRTYTLSILQICFPTFKLCLIVKKKFFSCGFFPTFWSSNPGSGLDPDPIRISIEPKMPDTDQIIWGSATLISHWPVDRLPSVFRTVASVYLKGVIAVSLEA